MRNKFVYSCSIKLHASGFNKLLESIFCILLIVEVFSLQKIVEMLEEMVVSWWEVRWIWQNFVAQFVQLLKRWLYDTRSSVVVKNWALSVDHCPLQALQFSVHLINLLSILLRCNGFAGIQKAVVDQTTQQWLWPLFWCKFGFGKCFGASPEKAMAPHSSTLAWKIPWMGESGGL